MSVIEKRFAVIGDPIEHSLSPALFASVFDKLGLPHCYRSVRVHPEELAAFLGRVRAGEFAGVSVTIPHKERVITQLDVLDETAQILGAVNTVAVADGSGPRRLIGYNTDVVGFSRSLQGRSANIKGERAVLLGAGGAARAVVCALISMGVAEVVIVNRSRERAERLISEISRATGFAAMRSVEFSDLRPVPTIRDAKLLVNATPVGMHPHNHLCPLDDPSGLHEELMVFDLVYHPLETRLLRRAADHGAQTIDGLDTLIHQALEALRIWVNCDVSGALFGKVRSHLVERLSA